MDIFLVMQEQASISQINQISQMLVDILPALQRLHDQGKLHGDITPEHISWQPEISAYQLAPSTSSIANPVYSAPEHLKGKPSAASDLYSLGVTCIHLLTGIHPFELLDLNERKWIWRDYWLADTGNNQRIAAVIDRLIQPNLAQRWQSAAAVLAEITQVTGLVIAEPPTLWTCRNILAGHSGLFAAITSLALSSKWLASGSEDKTIRLWDLATGLTTYILSRHQGFVEAVAFQPNSANILASGSRDKTIKIWDLDRVLFNLAGHTQAVNTVAFSPDGFLLASGSSDRTVKLWEVATGQ
jgi:WD40 repeat protein